MVREIEAPQTVIELSSGLTPDDRLIESPPDGIADGELVRIAVVGGQANPRGETGKSERSK